MRVGKKWIYCVPACPAPQLAYSSLAPLYRAVRSAATACECRFFSDCACLRGTRGHCEPRRTSLPQSLVRSRKHRGGQAVHLSCVGVLPPKSCWVPSSPMPEKRSQNRLHVGPTASLPIPFRSFKPYLALAACKAEWQTALWSTCSHVCKRRHPVDEDPGQKRTCVHSSSSHSVLAAQPSVKETFGTGDHSPNYIHDREGVRVVNVGHLQHNAFETEGVRPASKRTSKNCHTWPKIENGHYCIKQHLLWARPKCSAFRWCFGARLHHVQLLAICTQWTNCRRSEGQFTVMASKWACRCYGPGELIHIPQYYTVLWSNSIAHMMQYASVRLGS